MPACIFQKMSRRFITIVCRDELRVRMPRSAFGYIPNDSEVYLPHVTSESVKILQRIEVENDTTILNSLKATELLKVAAVANEIQNQTIVHIIAQKLAAIAETKTNNANEALFGVQNRDDLAIFFASIE